MSCQKTHLLVAVDKFTKWVEVEPVSRVDGASAVIFFKKIATRFGYPHVRKVLPPTRYGGGMAKTKPSQVVSSQTMGRLVLCGILFTGSDCNLHFASRVLSIKVLNWIVIFLSFFGPVVSCVTVKAAFRVVRPADHTIETI